VADGYVLQSFGSPWEALVATSKGVVMYIQHQHDWSALHITTKRTCAVDPGGRQLVFGDSALCFAVMRVVASPTIFFVLGKNSQAQLDTISH
jgi:hypothetical protein